MACRSCGGGSSFSQPSVQRAAPQPVQGGGAHLPSQGQTYRTSVPGAAGAGFVKNTAPNGVPVSQAPPGGVIVRKRI